MLAFGLGSEDVAAKIGGDDSPVPPAEEEGDSSPYCAGRPTVAVPLHSWHLAALGNVAAVVHGGRNKEVDAPAVAFASPPSFAVWEVDPWLDSGVLHREEGLHKD